jgi:hypothetical protein
LPYTLFAQRLTGRVIDAETGTPVVYATVSAASSNSITSYSGQYALNGLSRKDTIRVNCIGYHTSKIAYNKVVGDTLTIYLRQNSVMLRDVNVKARHNFKQDSIDLRRQFAAIFNYKGPSVKDLFVNVDPYVYVPDNYKTSQNNATMLLNVDLLSVINFLGKNKAPETKLQRTLIQDEENNYVDQRFSKEKITGVTSLKNDSLADFIIMYRPGIAQTKKMTDYQMILYIKKSYADFTKTYDPKRSLLTQ